MLSLNVLKRGRKNNFQILLWHPQYTTFFAQRITALTARLAVYVCELNTVVAALFDTQQPREIAIPHSVFVIPLDYTATVSILDPNPHSHPWSVWSTFFQWVPSLMRLFHTGFMAATIPLPTATLGIL